MYIYIYIYIHIFRLDADIGIDKGRWVGGVSLSLSICRSSHLALAWQSSESDGHEPPSRFLYSTAVAQPRERSKFFSLTRKSSQFTFSQLASAGPSNVAQHWDLNQR